MLPKSADTAKTNLNFERKKQNINPRQILAKVTKFHNILKSC